MTLAPAEIIARAKTFFADRVPNTAAFPEKEGPGFLTLRGQGGEEIAMAMTSTDGITRIRASTLFFDQAVIFCPFCGAQLQSREEIAAKSRGR